jgi:crossover junction endodeoxyribonuclease RusA
VNRVEFRVTGTPISHQSHNRQLLKDWQAAVAAAARKVVEHGTEPFASTVELHVTYYFENGSARIPDEDNLLKPIQDALIGILYRDDSQVMDGTCRKRDIEQAFVVRYMSRVLADGFVEGEEFVHVVVSDAPDPEVLRP